MNREWVLTRESFELLLDWLGPDREQAGQTYEKIRLRLIKIFACRGCNQADELADETINRVTAKLKDIGKTYSGDPALYFYGVAQKVHLEYLRNRPQLRESPLEITASGQGNLAPSPDSTDDIEREYECLEKCMEQLPRQSRQLVLEYYQDEKRAKIDHRKKLADQLGIAVNALRIRAHRIRVQLQVCVQDCLQQRPAN
jgi:RNA polymerase sigma factor (sigma-70 family)